MSDDEKRDLILTVIDVIFKQMDLDRLEAFFTDDFINHDGPGCTSRAWGIS